MSKTTFSDSSFLGIPLKEITGLLIFPLFVTIKVISKYPLTDKFFLSFIDNESELTAILPSKNIFPVGALSIISAFFLD